MLLLLLPQVFVNDPRRVRIVCDLLERNGLVAAPLAGDSSRDDRKEARTRPPARAPACAFARPCVCARVRACGVRACGGDSPLREAGARESALTRN